MSFHFNFEALQKNDVIFPPGFMKNIYENGKENDLYINFPGWKKFSEIDDFKLNFETSNNGFKELMPEYTRAFSNIFHLNNGDSSNGNTNSSFSYTPVREQSVCYAL